MENYSKEEQYLKAKKRVDQLKGFYWHLASYIIVNTFISSVKVVSHVNNGETFAKAFFDFGTFAVWFMWGIGLAFHAFGVFGVRLVFGSNWEERKIKKFIKEEQERASKWE